MHHSYTADVTSNIGTRVELSVSNAKRLSDEADNKQRDEVQAKIEELKAQGFLKRQEYVAATTSDFERLFLKRS